MSAPSLLIPQGLAQPRAWQGCLQGSLTTTGSRETGLPGEGAWGPGDSFSARPALLLQGEVTIHYNKLQADPKQGMSLDIGERPQPRVSSSWRCAGSCLVVLDSFLTKPPPRAGRPPPRGPL